MTLSPRIPAALAAMLFFLGTSPAADAAEATVILSQECEYLLLDSSQGQILLKVIKGEKPKAGDRLQGDFRQREFTELKVVRTGGTLGAWVDMVDPSASRALMRFSQYCN